MQKLSLIYKRVSNRGEKNQVLDTKNQSEPRVIPKSNEA
jgi:hypothetical protein